MEATGPALVVEEVATEEVMVRFRMRTPREENVRELAESIQTIGLLNPITIDNQNFLIAGFHRLKAYQLLGRTKIPCIRKDFSRVYAELGEIDENLKMASLCRISQAEHMVRREELYADLGLRVKCGHSKESSEMWTTKDIAELHGTSNRVYRLRRQPFSIVEDVRDELRDTRYAYNLMDMVKLSQQNVNAQRRISHLLISGKHTTFKRALVEGNTEIHRKEKDYKIEFNMKERFGIPHSIANFKKESTELQSLCNLVSKDPEVEWIKRDIQFGSREIPVYQMAASHAEFLINYYVPEGGLVLDQFMGRATTCFATLCSRRRFIGYDVDIKNVRKTEEIIDAYLPDFKDKCQLFHSDGTSLEELEDRSDYLDGCCCDPPYIAQNERYTSDDRDLSNMNYKQYINRMDHNFKQLHRLIKRSNFDRKEFYPVIFKVGTGRRGEKGICDMSCEFQYLAKSNGFVLWDLFYNQLNTPWAAVCWERNYINKYVQKNHEANLVFVKF